MLTALPYFFYFFSFFDVFWRSFGAFDVLYRFRIKAVHGVQQKIKEEL